jgi:hypothetical protein
MLNERKRTEYALMLDFSMPTNSYFLLKPPYFGLITNARFTSAWETGSLEERSMATGLLDQRHNRCLAGRLQRTGARLAMVLGAYK